MTVCLGTRPSSQHNQLGEAFPLVYMWETNTRQIPQGHMSNEWSQALTSILPDSKAHNTTLPFIKYGSCPKESQNSLNQLEINTASIMKG